MDFYALLDQVLDLLRQRGRVTYRALKRQFDLDDAVLEDLKAEIIEAHRLAVDAEGTMLVWTGDAALVPPPAAVPVPPPERPPLDYTPTYLAEKILTARLPSQASASRSLSSLPTSRIRRGSSRGLTQRWRSSSWIQLSIS